jgi:hypothetical protein
VQTTPKMISTLSDTSLQPDTANSDERFQAIWRGNHLPTIRLNMLNQTCRHRFLSQALSRNNCGHLLKQLSYNHPASPQNMCSYLTTAKSLLNKIIFSLHEKQFLRKISEEVKHDILCLSVRAT